MDPNNLSFWDLIRIIGPIVVGIALVIFAYRYLPVPDELISLVLIFGVLALPFLMPKKDLDNITEKMAERDRKIERIPVIGNLYTVWNLLYILGALVLVVYSIYLLIMKLI